jgi:hypothetical protein
LAALLNTVPYFLGHQDDDGAGCFFQAFVMTWFDWNVLMWVLCLTHKLGLNILYQKEGKEYERLYYALGYGFGLVIAIIPAAMNMYGPAGVWCWIREGQSTTTALRFGIWCECPQHDDALGRTLVALLAIPPCHRHGHADSAMLA